jgi:threonine/homoserine/homoserine lactone efflux protein
MKYIGAAYLIYLGIRKLLTRQELHQPEMQAERTLVSLFYQGILVNILNPKTGVFFLAFLPQFEVETATLSPVSTVQINIFTKLALWMYI